MPALIGGFFRLGRLVIEYLCACVEIPTPKGQYLCASVEKLTPVNPTVRKRSKGSRLNTAVIPNELWLWGCTKWRKGSSRPRYSSILPSLAVYVSWAKVNFYLKDGPAIINRLLLGLKSNKLGIEGLGTVLLWIHPNGHTITGSNSNNYPSNTLGQSQVKQGNPGQLWAKPITSGLRASLTYHISKLMQEYDSRHGGKMAEKANAKGNALDTQYPVETYNRVKRPPIQGVLLNSVCLNEVTHNFVGRRNKIQDLNKARLMTSLSTSSLQIMREEVAAKQRELVKLAKLNGLYDKEVLDRQLILVRSKLFREYAVKLISMKPGSQTPPLPAALGYGQGQGGVDKEIYDKANEGTFEDLVEYLRKATYQPNNYRATPIRRVWIPKPGKEEKRPLGIPSIKDRALQALINLVLLPLVELTSDPNSYGYRPHRDCKMAIAAVRAQLKTIDVLKIRNSINKRHPKFGNSANYLIANQEKWILDADIKGFFDNINHNWILDNIFLNPQLNKLLEQWLKAKILDAGVYTDPLSGTPQGGIISPTLANFTLNGLEEAVKKSLYPLTKSTEQRMQIKLKDGSFRRISLATELIRYTDDFVVITRSKNLLGKYVSPAIHGFLKERGLRLSPEKTKQYRLDQPKAQLEFLGYTFKYNAKWSPKRTMIYSRQTPAAIALYPNKKRVNGFILKLKGIFDESQNLSAMELITKLNPIIRGWANYFNLENSSHYRSVVREGLYRLTWSWIRKKHPTLGKVNLAKLYFLREHLKPKLDEIDDSSPILEGAITKDGYLKFKNYKWVLYGSSNTVSRFTKKLPQRRLAFLLNPTNCSPIVAANKHLMPLELRRIHAFDERIGEVIQMKLKLALLSTPKTPTLKEKLFKTQKGLCSLCQKPIDPDYLHYNSVHIHHIKPIQSGGSKFAISNLALTHSWCHREHKH